MRDAEEGKRNANGKLVPVPSAADDDDDEEEEDASPSANALRNATCMGVRVLSSNAESSNREPPAAVTAAAAEAARADEDTARAADADGSAGLKRADMLRAPLPPARGLSINDAREADGARAAPAPPAAAAADGDRKSVV